MSVCYFLTKLSSTLLRIEIIANGTFDIVGVFCYPDCDLNISQDLITSFGQVQPIYKTLYAQ